MMAQNMEEDEKDSVVIFDLENAHGSCLSNDNIEREDYTIPLKTEICPVEETRYTFGQQSFNKMA